MSLKTKLKPCNGRIDNGVKLLIRNRKLVGI